MLSCDKTNCHSSIVNPCDSSPCKNGATCENYRNTFLCDCAEGFEGDTCEEGKVIIYIIN